MAGKHQVSWGGACGSCGTLDGGKSLQKLILLVPSLQPKMVPSTTKVLGLGSVRRGLGLFWVGLLGVCCRVSLVLFLVFYTKKNKRPAAFPKDRQASKAKRRLAPHGYAIELSFSRGRFLVHDFQPSFLSKTGCLPLGC